MKRLTIIVGAGGTGSYVLPNLLAFYNGLAGNVENKIILMDGDFVEEKNLLRQGFLQNSLNQYKSDALVNTYGHAYEMDVQSKPTFLNNADSLLSIVKEHSDELEDVVLISCVDNNFARLRMVVGQHLIKQFYPEMEVTFVDSGNEEWHGQSIVTSIDSDSENILAFENGKMIVKDENYTEDSVYDNIFVRMADWENHLTKGDHEISCDVVTVSHPQNVATNMTAASLIINSLGRLVRGFEPKNISFNAKLNKFELYNITDKENYIRTLNEIADFINADEEFSVIGRMFKTVQGNKSSVNSKVNDRPLEIDTHIEDDNIIIEDDFFSSLLGLTSDSLESETEVSTPQTESTPVAVLDVVEVVEHSEVNDSLPLSEILSQDIDTDFSDLIVLGDNEQAVSVLSDIEVENTDFSDIVVLDTVLEYVTSQGIENETDTLIEYTSSFLNTTLDNLTI